MQDATDRMALAIRRAAVVVVAAVLALAPAGCGGAPPNGGGSDPPAPPTLELFYGPRRVIFTWAPVERATHYLLREDPEGDGAFVTVANDIVGTAVGHDISLLERVRARYTVSACNAAGCTPSSITGLVPYLLDAIETVDDSTGGVGDRFGSALAISADGTTLAIAAPLEDGSATGVGGSVDEAAQESGAVYVFRRVERAWTLEAYVKASDTASGDTFGMAIALSADGGTLAVSATNRDVWLGGTPFPSAGGVYVFARTVDGWTEQARLEPPHPTAFALFGAVLALSEDGDTLAVGELFNDSGAVGIDGDGSDTSMPDAGAAYVFARTAGTWKPQAFVKATNPDPGDRFGLSLSLSADGSTLAVGADAESSGSQNPDDDGAPRAGAVYLLTRTAGAWAHTAFVKGPAPAAESSFGTRLLLSADASTLLVSARAPQQPGVWVPIVHVLERIGDTWTSTGELRAPNGWGVMALSHDGSTLAFGVTDDASAARGIDGDEFDASRPAAGAAYVFTRTSGAWARSAYVKGPLSRADERFGTAVALAGDGRLLVVSAARQSGVDVGAVYAY